MLVIKFKNYKGLRVKNINYTNLIYNIMSWKTQCKICGSEIEVPNDVLNGEIISCPMCGIRYVIKIKEEGSIELEEFKGEVEDYGE